jgi:flotillin
MATALALAIIAVLAVLFVIMIVSSLIVICPPNKVAVISGRTRTLSDGRTVGYRILKGGRTLRIPILEKVSWMDLSTIPLEVSVTNAYSKGAIPLNVQGIANVKVSSAGGSARERRRALPRPPHRADRPDRQGDPRSQPARCARHALARRGQRGPAEVLSSADRRSRRRHQDVGPRARRDEDQNVTDDNQYLDSVGRRLTAEVVKQARVAEAERMAESEAAEAAARERAQIATVQADKNIVEEQNQLRVRTAELEAIAKAKEEEASVAGDIARATAEQELEQQRIELERRRLEADVVTPAKANLEAKQLAAQAEAAKIIEDGKAQVEVFQRLTEQYQAAGDDGQRIFVLNMLPELVDKIVSTVNNVDIDRVAIVDNGGGQGGGIPGLVSQLPGAVVSLTEQIEAATGVDILGSMRSDHAESEPDSELPPPPPAPEA